MSTVGKVHELTRQFDFEWRIEDYFSLSTEEGNYYRSTSFLFAGESWYLSLYPNCQSQNSAGYIGIFLYRKSGGFPISLAYSFGLRSYDGTKDKESQFTSTFNESGTAYGAHLLKKSELLENKAHLVPSGILTIICTLEYSNSAEDERDTVKVKCSHCKNAFDAIYFYLSHEEKCLYKPISCPTCNDTVQLNKWFQHRCKMARVIATKKVLNDFGNILKSKEHSDVTIKVKDKLFHLHRNILAGRSPYFHSMFSTEMKEKTTGIVTINDCEPNIFESFINFLYTGETETLSNDNVCSLFETADKYQEDQLQAECLSFMKDKLSVDNFCDFMVLALNYGETGLLRNATDLFCRKTKEIIQNVKWQTFIRTHPTQANELFIKACDYNVK